MYSSRGLLGPCCVWPPARLLHAGGFETSRPFAQSERLSRFLRFIVERSLEGRSEEIKELVIAAEVFDRPGGSRLLGTVRVRDGEVATGHLRWERSGGSRTYLLEDDGHGRIVIETAPGAHPLDADDFAELRRRPGRR